MDPLTLGAGALLTGGYLLANMFGSNAAERARNKVIQNNNIAQSLLAQEAALTNAHSLGLYGNFQGGMDAQKQQLGDCFAGAAAPKRTGNASNSESAGSSSGSPRKDAGAAAAPIRHKRHEGAA